MLRSSAESDRSGGLRKGKAELRATTVHTAADKRKGALCGRPEHGYGGCRANYRTTRRLDYYIKSLAPRAIKSHKYKEAAVREDA